MSRAIARVWRFFYEPEGELVVEWWIVIAIVALVIASSGCIVQTSRGPYDCTWTLDGIACVRVGG